MPWTHNVILIQKLKDLPSRLWYAREVLVHGWSRDTLALHIKNREYERRGSAVSNFTQSLTPLQSDLTDQVLKDP